MLSLGETFFFSATEVTAAEEAAETAISASSFSFEVSSFLSSEMAPDIMLDAWLSRGESVFYVLLLFFV